MRSTLLIILVLAGASGSAQDLTVARAVATAREGNPEVSAARSAADAALMQNVMSGPYNRDIASLRTRVRIDTENVLPDLRGWKIAWSMDL